VWGGISIGLQHGRVLLMLKDVRLWMMRTRAESKFCLRVRVRPHGAASVSQFRGPETRVKLASLRALPNPGVWFLQES
jgi:hypothetical protein